MTTGGRASWGGGLEIVLSSLSVGRESRGPSDTCHSHLQSCVYSTPHGTCTFCMYMYMYDVHACVHKYNRVENREDTCVHV